MLQPDLGLQIRLLSDALKLPEGASAERVAEIPRLEPGQPVTARVQEQLADGRFRVLVAGRNLSMQLPAETRPGQNVRLAYVGPMPQLNFGLLESSGPVSYSATVSSAGRLVSSLVLGLPAQPTHIAAAEPVLGAEPMSGSEIAPRLRQALAQSGLFYESHQARWVAGDHPLEQLLQEPQGQLSPRAAPDIAAQAQASPAMTSDPSNAPATTRHDTGAQDIPAHPDTLPLIQHQLSTLESGQILWQGQIWPGQTMDWEIAEHPGDATDAEQQSAWDTRLSLDMTVLGPLDARLSIRQGKVAIVLQADSDDTAALMQQRSPELVRAMESAGLAVASLSVARHAP